MVKKNAQGVTELLGFIRMNVKQRRHLPLQLARVTAFLVRGCVIE
ncbi:hypothetical protein HMPREF0758_1980 [Serratia odorifera DSM 4582]|uniref:Uncharacterized protein n=1 Tax=Serratia odorifera DSM 4582 TaxID=667129 RepID=D4E0U8_SEROD|nr:hypothetical protein HMPREF0758_1980 [Serratia odorifera DSM 4582]